MNVIKDAETEQLLDDSKRLRARLADAVAELDHYVAALQEYVERLHEAPPEGKK